MKRTSILLLTLGLIVTAHAKVLRVDDDGPADYATIAEALEAAVTGDEIVVADGYYAGPPDLPPSVGPAPEVRLDLWRQLEKEHGPGLIHHNGSRQVGDEIDTRL